MILLLALLLVGLVSLPSLHARLWKAVVDRSTEAETAMFDAERFSKLAARRGTADEGKKRDATCVIIGGSIAGCMMACVASHHYARVIVVEPSTDDASRRSRVMQYDQVHIFSNFAVESLHRLWPDAFEAGAVARGGRFDDTSTLRFELLLGAHLFRWDERAPRFGPSGKNALAISRPVMQDLLADLAAHHTPGVEVVRGRVTGMVCDGKSGLVSQVHVVLHDGQPRPATTTTTTTTTLDCGLLIDCSGPAQVYRRLIRGDGRFAEPQRESYRINIAYASATFALDAAICDRMPLPATTAASRPTWGQASPISFSSPLLTEQSSYASMAHTDGDKCYLGWMKYDAAAQEMPTDLATFGKCMRATYRANTGAEPGAWFDESMALLAENEAATGHKVRFVHARGHDSYVCRIDARHRRLPANLVLVGDSFCKLNPAFGQGTEKAMMDCLALSTSLGRWQAMADVMRDFEARRSTKTYTLFDFNRALDLASPEVRKLNPTLAATTGWAQRTALRALLRYLDRYGDVARSNVLVGVVFGATGSAALLHPWMLVAIVWGLFLGAQ